MKKLLFSIFILVWFSVSICAVYAADLHLTGNIDTGFYQSPDGDIIAGKIAESDAPCVITPGSRVVAAGAARIRLKKGFSVKKTARFTGVITSSTDTDADTIPDWWEAIYGLDPSNGNDAALDADNDGLSNLAEYQGKTDPKIHEKPILDLFYATPQAIPQGAAVRLTWESRFATSCTIEPGNLYSPRSKASFIVKPLETTTYTITATGPTGTISQDVIVTVNNVLPRITFRASHPKIFAGNSNKLSWSVLNADSVTIDNDIGPQSFQGDISVSPTQTTTYNLTAQNAQGTTSAEAEIIVIPPKPKVTLSALPIIVVSGQDTTLSWTSSYATAGSIDMGVGAIAEADLASGSKTIPHTGTKIYTITVTGPGGEASDTVLVGDDTDTDGDGIPDVWETTYGMDPNNPADAELDNDGDLITNKMEYLQGLDPNSYNAEDLELSGTLSGNFYSGGEIIINPGQIEQSNVSADSTLSLTANCRVRIRPVFRVPKGSRFTIKSGDCDLLPDSWEREHLGTTAYSDDSDPDNDGLNNYDEYLINSDPSTYDQDNDDDGLNDKWELMHFGNLKQGPDNDFDDDGIKNKVEQLTKSDPADSDSFPKPGNYYEYDAVGRIKRIIRIQ